MRGHLASSIAVTCAAALALPLALSSEATATPPAAERPTAGSPAPERTAPDDRTPDTPASGVPVPGRRASGPPASGPSASGEPVSGESAYGRPAAYGRPVHDRPAYGRAVRVRPASPGASTVLPEAAPAAPTAARTTRAAAVPGSTQSFPLTPLPPGSALRTPSSAPSGDRALPPSPSQPHGLARRDVRHFSLVGVVWDDPDSELHGRVQVRTRAGGTTDWSAWQDLEAHNHEHAADPDTAERASGRVRGSTAPLWVGDSDGVEVRVRPTATATTADGRTGGAHAAEPLPGGLRVELVDPGAGPASQDPGPETGHAGFPAAESAASAANAALAPAGATEIPALSRKETRAALSAARGVWKDAAGVVAGQRARPYIGARPRIVTRRGWGADEGLRERKFSYTKTVRAAFVHHSATGNNYRCAQAPSVIRSIYRYHVRSSGWRDIGYNFLVDKCGNIYEGRAGGVARPVMGAHTLGFNSRSTGIAVLGSFGATNPPAAVVKAVARLTAWKLGLHGANPRGKTYLTSGGGNLYRKGKNVRLNVISGHRDGFATECPGRRLYAKLGKTRAASARYQGR
ncbi:peptidoglycan recognition protein family protein [Streptomyces beigongshangae]|uniref:peptidoglycan recognition protein family protein n=1 Tax=Streptomyces beigongshangae TaxID=2841597 RepID=UPI0021A77538|nr:N-acetylmuramoyl-L-alanine amidase [Streptomyces sp. REN17]